MQEIWKQVDGYGGRYEISNLGRLKSYAQDKKNGKIKTGSKTHKGYLTIKLYAGRDGERESKFRPIHRLVAEAFIPNPENLPQINHKDEDKTNNRADNLEWCTNEYNMTYGTRLERVALANRACPATSLKVQSVDASGAVAIYNSIGEAERLTGLSHSNIVRALKGRAHTCGGRKWYYL